MQYERSNHMSGATFSTHFLYSERHNPSIHRIFTAILVKFLERLKYLRGNSPPPLHPVSFSRLNPGKAVDVTCFSVELRTPGNILHV